jgi:DNA-binding LytR/AlgR family response regulator
MKGNTIINPKVTVNLSVEGESFPTAIEMEADKEKIIAHLKSLGECRDTSFREKPLLIPDKNGLQRINGQDILYIEAERSYCTLHFHTGKKLFVASPMINFEDYFNNKGFVRIHKCHVVNIQKAPQGSGAGTHILRF